MAKHNSKGTRPTGVVYVGRTEGEQVQVLGKVGLVQEKESLESRAQSYRVADRVFFFVLEGAYEVRLPDRVCIKDVETRVHSMLEQHFKLSRIGENFRAPEGSMTFLARMVEEALRLMEFEFTPLDVTEIQMAARRKNSEIWDRLRHGKRHLGTSQISPESNEDWVYRNCYPPVDQTARERPRDYVRAVMALGHILRDAGAGSGMTVVKVPLQEGGELAVYPPTLEQAQAELDAEANLYLGSTLSFSVRVDRSEKLPNNPIVMSLVIGQNLESLEVPPPFLVPSEENPCETKWHPEHLAALGLVGGAYNEQCWYEGLGVRARLPLPWIRVARKHPELLPGIRFWRGLNHCLDRAHIRVHDFPLPMEISGCWELISNAAIALREAGIRISRNRQAWVSHAWFPPCVR